MSILNWIVLLIIVGLTITIIGKDMSQGKHKSYSPSSGTIDLLASIVLLLVIGMIIFLGRTDYDIEFSLPLAMISILLAPLFIIIIFSLIEKIRNNQSAGKQSINIFALLIALVGLGLNIQLFINDKANMDKIVKKFIEDNKLFIQNEEPFRDALKRTNNSINKNSEKLDKNTAAIVELSETLDGDNILIAPSGNIVTELNTEKETVSVPVKKDVETSTPIPPPVNQESTKDVPNTPHTINEPEVEILEVEEPELEPAIQPTPQLFDLETDKYESEEIKQSSSQISGQDVADGLFNLGVQKYEESNLVESRKIFTQANKQYSKLAKKEPDIYTRVLAMTQYNLGLINFSLQKNTLKKSNFALGTNRILSSYKGALEKFCSLAQTKPDMYTDYAEQALINLSLLYFEGITQRRIDSAEVAIILLGEKRETSPYSVSIESVIGKLWECGPTMSQYLTEHNVSKSEIFN